MALDMDIKAVMTSVMPIMNPNAPPMAPGGDPIHLGMYLGVDGPTCRAGLWMNARELITLFAPR